MPKTSEITPALNSQILEATQKALPGGCTKKQFDAEFNEQIKKAGFSPKSYHAYMRKYFDNSGDF